MTQPEVGGPLLVCSSCGAKAMGYSDVPQDVITTHERDGWTFSDVRAHCPACWPICSYCDVELTEYGDCPDADEPWNVHEGNIGGPS